MGTHEVIPMIRRTGGIYLTHEKADDIVNDPDLIIAIATQVKELNAAVVKRYLVIKENKLKPRLLLLILCLSG